MRLRTQAARGFALALALVALMTGAVAAQETLTLLHCWGEHRAEWVEEMAASFSAAHPGIEVSVQLTGCGNTLREAFLTAYLGGASPDVVMIHSLDIPAMAELGALTPLDGYIERDGIPFSTWYPSEIGSAHWQGSHFGLPIRTGGDANTLLYYNKDLFGAAGLPDSPPTTWAELDDAARKLIRYQGDDLVQAAIAPYGGDSWTLAWLASGGGNLLSEDGRTVLFGSPEAADTAAYAYSHFAELYRGGLAELDAFVNGQGGIRSAFPAGTLAMQFNGSWEASYITDANPDVNFGIGLRPSREPGGSPGAHAGTYHYAIPAGVKNPDAAWELVKWLTLREETAGYFMLRQGRPSPVVAFNSNPAFLELNPYWYVIGEALARVTPITLIPVVGEVIGFFDRAFMAVLRGEASPSALSDAARQAQAVVDAFWSERE